MLSNLFALETIRRVCESKSNYYESLRVQQGSYISSMSIHPFAILVFPTDEKAQEQQKYLTKTFTQTTITVSLQHAGLQYGTLMAAWEANKISANNLKIILLHDPDQLAIQDHIDRGVCAMIKKREQTQPVKRIATISNLPRLYTSDRDHNKFERLFHNVKFEITQTRQYMLHCGIQEAWMGEHHGNLG
ncbi:hypothetical protein Tdes44962_MAKER04305 [Teratosphaeria destructans]|uniref:Uncharacterized protein n=1 Tax=Teratosphaeria destructans TaxID=418781 RepID=A0A9W7SMH6_9PEZI|nr:hypothetical protein Tdes44962_MAKER04305 [Teratosphaeria destructans]